MISFNLWRRKVTNRIEFWVPICLLTSQLRWFWDVMLLVLVWHSNCLFLPPLQLWQEQEQEIKCRKLQRTRINDREQQKRSNEGDHSASWKQYGDSFFPVAILTKTSSLKEEVASGLHRALEFRWAIYSQVVLETNQNQYIFKKEFPPSPNCVSSMKQIEKDLVLKCLDQSFHFYRIWMFSSNSLTSVEILNLEKDEQWCNKIVRLNLKKWCQSRRNGKQYNA